MINAGLGIRGLALALCAPFLLSCSSGGGPKAKTDDESKQEHKQGPVNAAYGKAIKAMARADTGYFMLEAGPGILTHEGVYQLSTRSFKGSSSAPVDNGESFTIEAISVRDRIWFKPDLPDQERCWTSTDLATVNQATGAQLGNLAAAGIPSILTVLLDGHATKWTGYDQAHGASTVISLLGNMGNLDQLLQPPTRTRTEVDVEFEFSDGQFSGWKTSMQDVVKAAVAHGARMPAEFTLEDFESLTLDATVRPDGRQVQIEPPSPEDSVKFTTDEATYERELAACEAR